MASDVAASRLSSTTRMRRFGPGGWPLLSGVSRRQRLQAALQRREPDGERAALALPVALGRDRAAVHLDQALTSASPMPSPPVERSMLRSTWENMSKMLGRDVGRDADPGVADGDDDLVPAPLGGRARCGRPARCTWRCWSAGC